MAVSLIARGFVMWIVDGTYGNRKQPAPVRQFGLASARLFQPSSLHIALDGDHCRRRTGGPFPRDGAGVFVPDFDPAMRVTTGLRVLEVRAPSLGGRSDSDRRSWRRRARDRFRWVVLRRLMCVTEIAALEKESVSTISQRLRVLRSEDLIVRRRRGKHIDYALADQHVMDLLFNALAHATERPAATPSNEDLEKENRT